MRNHTVILFLLKACAFVAFGQGTILWDESVNGELSMSYTSATALPPLQLGTNSIIGKTEIEPTGPNWLVHPDYFSITVPSNLSVTGVYLSINKPNVWTWIGDPTFVNQLAFAQSPTPGDLLSQWGLSSVGPGAYGVYLDNHDAQSITSIASYRLDFVTQSIPEPGPLGLWLTGATCAAVYGWRRAKKKVGQHEVSARKRARSGRVWF
jgi:hypothetical protein